jgi:putative oxidoreductase
MNDTASRPACATAAILLGRLIFAALFLMAVSFKLMDIPGTAGQIAAAGFPLSGLLVWLAVVFLAFGFHGPSHWAANQDELGFFIDHLTFAAGLLFAAACGPGRVLALNRRAI